MKQIIKTIFINRCFDCDYRHFNEKENKNICALSFGLEIPNANIIPVWCRLDEAPPQNKEEKE